MNCRLCKGNDLKLHYVQGHQHQFNYYKCRHCGLVNLDLENLKITETQKKYADRFKPPKDYEKEHGACEAYKFGGGERT